jgi:hypothetical protein
MFSGEFWYDSMLEVESSLINSSEFLQNQIELVVTNFA